MKGDRLKASVLAVKLIPNIDSDMAKELLYQTFTRTELLHQKQEPMLLH